MVSRNSAPQAATAAPLDAAAVVASILRSIRGLPAYQQLTASIGAGDQPHSLRLPRAARLPILAALHAELKRPVMLLTDRADHALSLYDELGFWLTSDRHLFAEPTPLFYEEGAWGVTTRRERLQTLMALAAQHLPFADAPPQPPVIVTSARSLMTRTLPRRDYLLASKRLTQGADVQLQGLIRDLTRIGYQRVNTVLEPGQYAHRGGLLDVWPASDSSPTRLDFFGDQLEALRRFDPATQRTLESIEHLLITPAREYLLPASSSGETEYSEFHLPVLNAVPASLLDYLPQKTLILIDDLSLIESTVNEVEEQAVKLRQESIDEQLLPADFPVPYLPWSELSDSLQGYPLLQLGHSGEESQESSSSLASLFGHDERFGGRLKPFSDYLVELWQAGEQVHVISRQAHRLRDLWNEDPARQASTDNPKFLEASLSEGFTLLREHESALHLITDSEIFGWERPQPRIQQKQLTEAPESVYADLQAGDLVVHIDHGIGRFGGLIQRQLDGHEREFLAVEYEGGDALFVPVHQADRLTRYIGPDAGAPGLDRLGGQQWTETKVRVKEAVRKVAEELLDLYARRQVVMGFAFSADTTWQAELEDSFPYVETEDQKRAIGEIKQDMERARPMDRLLCGDVGYGKTEVALRAAFKAVMDGRQVAILVPTTVLAQQHYDTFTQRLAAFPVKVEMLSRFRTPREQSEILRLLATGEVDIVIGTHRLISSDVEFKDLGLVVIDEEQRFGVTHKEHLKKLRTEVDVLTLTATPIPRTLYMALTGVRDISNLNTAPEERLPIATHVGPYSPRLVRQSVLRELERGGQIFFVHNRVHTIDAMRAHLQKLVPEARVDIAHGQMPEQQLAAVMHRFNMGEIDVLLSTTIIESGLDIPNANTLIVDRADTFGLAQLYQLRGRVGRGAMRAYAYFFRHGKLSPTLEGQQRLEVIAENTQLGAGYSIAMRDLEIRGAGDLLGTRQHGHIAAVGFHLYTRLLADAVRQLRRASADSPAGGSSPFANFNAPIAMPVNVDLPLAVGIPAAYIADRDLRLRLYRRIADLRDEREIDALAAEFNDRFGPLPEMVQNLFYQMRVKLLAEASGLSAINWEGAQVVLRLNTSSEEKPSKRLPDLGPGIRGGKGAYWCALGDQWRPRLLELLTRLSAGSHFS